MSTLLPGDVLPPTTTTPKSGVHLHASQPTSSLAALLTPPTLHPLPTSPLPSISSQILLRITRLTPRQATGTILTIASRPCPPYPVIIRAQDIRATEKDRLTPAACFRPGDVVRAEILSLGGAEGYYAGTARNELGVVAARSERGWEMGPLSWERMGEIGGAAAHEARKVARP